MNTENLIVVGKLGSSYGIRGWLRIFSFTEFSDSIFDYTPWYIQRAGKWQEVIVESFKPHNQDMIVKLKGVDDREQANALTKFEEIGRASCRDRVYISEDGGALKK